MMPRMKENPALNQPDLKVIDTTRAFAAASAKLLRNRGFPVDYLGHAQEAQSLASSGASTSSIVRSLDACCRFHSSSSRCACSLTRGSAFVGRSEKFRLM